jgi:hypothetical protein
LTEEEKAVQVIHDLAKETMGGRLGIYNFSENNREKQTKGFKL